jgi:CrcB protein
VGLAFHTENRRRPTVPAESSGRRGMSAASRRRIDPRAVAAVAAGAMIGGPLRYGVDHALPNGVDHPWATLAVNLGGSFTLGAILVVVFESTWSVRYLREFFGVGVLGSYTTFSTWMVELRGQAATSQWGLMAAYLVGSLVLGLLAVGVGAAAARLATTGRRR